MLKREKMMGKQGELPFFNFELQFFQYISVTGRFSLFFAVVISL